MNHPPLPSTCPHTFDFPATGSRLDKKDVSLEAVSLRIEGGWKEPLMFLWKEHHNFPIHLKCYQCAWSQLCW